jgi:ribosome-binding protein aMBF1 (putative translation factor)
MERCTRCHVDGEEVRLYDAIYEGRINKICERCSIIENVPIIKKPNTAQLKESEQGVGVFERMRRLSGIKDPQKEETFFRDDKLEELNKNPNLEMPENNRLDLITHFHWEIMKNRRRKGLSHKQLAEALGESEVVIQMIEKAKLPENAESIIKKLEQFFQTRLRKVPLREKITGPVRTTPVLLDEEGNILDSIPEEKPYIPEITEEDEEEIDEEFETEKPAEVSLVEETEGKLKPEPAEVLGEEEIILEPEKDLDLREIDTNKIRINDLKELHRKKIEATRQEKIEEQKRIEERQRLIAARKEELRQMKEKESKDLDKSLGGMELLGQKSESIDTKKEVDEFDKELI